MQKGIQVMVQYYKLKKDLPELKAGALFEFSELEQAYNDGVPFGYKYNEESVIKNPDWFEPCLFVSADGEPVFLHDKVYLLPDEVKPTSEILGWIITEGSWENEENEDNTNVYKSYEKAQKHLESLKPKESKLKPQKYSRKEPEVEAIYFDGIITNQDTEYLKEWLDAHSIRIIPSLSVFKTLEVHFQENDYNSFWVPNNRWLVKSPSGKIGVYSDEEFKKKYVV